MFSAKYENAASATIDLIRNLSIPITDKTLYDELEAHPNYPSVMST